jgi:hypothetical protein
MRISEQIQQSKNILIISVFCNFTGPTAGCFRRRACGQSYWLGFLCKTLSFSIPSRFIPALSLTLETLGQRGDAAFAASPLGKAGSVKQSGVAAAAGNEAHSAETE